jgi:hypothetical protein
LTHWRRLIRERVVARLTGTTLAGARVFDSLPWDRWPREVPAIFVYTGRDELEPWRQSGGRAYKATTTVHVELFVTSVGGPTPQHAAAVLDDLIEDVEAALDSDPTLRDPVAPHDRAACNGLEVSIETDFERGDRTVAGGARVTWRYEYVREALERPTPPTTGELEQLVVEYELPHGVNAVPEAVDDVPLPG